MIRNRLLYSVRIGRKRFRLLPVLLAVVTVWGNAGIMAVQATDATAAQTADPYQQELETVFNQEIQTNQLESWPAGTGIYAEAGIVMDAENGAILYAKNIDQREYPASITKLLTALLAFEYADMDDQVVITPECLTCLGQGYASIGMKEGNVITMEQALYAMLLASSNEVAYAVAETVAKKQGEDYQWFLDEMNRKVEELGGVNSHFANANGVFDEQHYTCARDMALIACALFKYPEFFTICQTANYTIPASDTTEEHVFQQKHEMLLPGYKNYYEYAVGGKTGYTTEANNTLVTMADNGELKLVCVTLKAYPGHVYPDTKALLDYGFSNFRKVKIGDGQKNKGIQKIPDDAYVTLPEGIDLANLKTSVDRKKGSKNEGVLRYTYEEHPVGEVQVEVSEELSFGNISRNDAEEKDGMSAGQIILTVTVILVAAVLSFFLYMKARLRRKRRRRRGRRRRK